MKIYGSPFADIALRDVSITGRLFEGLSLRPNAPALIDGLSGREVTGGELTAGIKALAGGLTAKGYGVGATVALMAPNIPEFVTVFHAVAWAGGTITTVNPTYTDEELRHQLNDAGATLLVTIPQFLDTARAGAQGTGVTEIAVIGEADGATPLAALIGDPLERQVPVDLDAHVLVLPYSSGTTGLPKGVMLSHRNLVANIEQIQTVRPVAPGERTVGFLPFFHIYGMTVLANLFLVFGGAVVTMPRFDLEHFLKLCQDHRTPQAFCVPPVVLALAKHPLVDRFELSALRHVFSGAAPLGASLGEAAAERLGVSCEQGYGMTEMSPASHITPKGRSRAGAIGFPIPNTQCRIVNPDRGADVEPGAEGELWVRGPQVMLGYQNNSEATAACLDGDGWLRTGDIASVDQDGYFFIRDRLKELIKVKGFQVAPAEIEAVLVTHPDIADAAVIGVPDDEAGEVPIAYLVASGEGRPTLQDVKAHLAMHLAHYKHVRRIEYVETVPKSASGKILRRLLRNRMPQPA